MSKTEFTHHSAQVKDVRMHYTLAGKGDPVVLLHGWPQSSACWTPVIEGLAGKYTVIAPDLRGLGSTTKATSGYDMNNVADDVYQLVRQLGYEKIFLVGHDWGAAAAYSYAAQHRDDVRRLAIFEMVLPGFGLMEGAMVPQPNGQFLWHMGFQTVPDVPFALIEDREDIYLNNIFQTYAYNREAVLPEKMTRYVDAMRNIGALRAGLEYYTSFFETAEQNKVHGETKLEMPVLAYAGEACLAGITKQCLELAASDVRGGVIDRCGHWITEERPDFVTDELLAFFGEE